VIKTRRVRWAGHARRLSEIRNEDIILVGKPECKKTKAVGRPRRRRKDDIKTDLKGIGCEVVDLSQLT
jgi:hypothetical protein